MSSRGERGRVAARVQELIDIGRGALDEPESPTARGARLSMHAPAAMGSGTAPAEPAGPEALDDYDDAPVRVAGRHSRAGDGGLRPRLVRLIARGTGVRLVPGTRAAAGMGLVALIAGVVTLCWMLAARPRSVPVGASAPAARSAPVSPVPSGGRAGAPVPATGSAHPPASPPGARRTTSPATVTVDVAGKVRHPGVYRLPAAARVDDAVQAAGGALPGVDLSGVNLAAPLHDGQQIAIGVAGAGPAPAPDAAGGTAPAASGGGAVPAGKVDLNTATSDRLQTLPGVGPVLAQHILDWRAAHGRFAAVTQLQEVSGIGPVKYAGLKGLVSV